MVTTKLTTVDDVEQIPEDDARYGLIREVLYRMPPPKPLDGRVTSTTGWYLRGFVIEHQLGVVYDQSGFVLHRDPDVLLAPALAFVQTERMPTDEESYPDLASDLVVEVISPSETGPDVETKMLEYLAAGVRLIWALDAQRRTVRVRTAAGDDHLLTGDDELAGGDVLPGFWLAVKLLFA